MWKTKQYEITYKVPRLHMDSDFCLQINRVICWQEFLYEWHTENHASVFVVIMIVPRQILIDIDLAITEMGSQTDHARHHWENVILLFHSKIYLLVRTMPSIKPLVRKYFVTIASKPQHAVSFKRSSITSTRATLYREIHGTLRYSDDVLKIIIRNRQCSYLPASLSGIAVRYLACVICISLRMINDK